MVNSDLEELLELYDELSTCPKEYLDDVREEFQEQYSKIESMITKGANGQQ